MFQSRPGVGNRGKLTHLPAGSVNLEARGDGGRQTWGRRGLHLALGLAHQFHLRWQQRSRAHYKVTVEFYFALIIDT